MSQADFSGERLVLLIEADSALRRIIALGLRQRGLRVLETTSLDDARETVREAPALVVQDIGVGTTSDWRLTQQLRRLPLLQTAPLITLAWECPAPQAHDLTADTQPPARVCLAKPFDARALYAAVDELIGAPGQAMRNDEESGAVPHRGMIRWHNVDRLAGEAVQSEDDESATGRSGSPAIWPVLAAGAATLAVAGFLIAPVYALVGLVLLLVVGLWWGTALTRPA